MTDPTVPPYQATPLPPYEAATPSEAGKGLGIAGFIVDFFVAPVGLILSIVAKVQSSRAGVKNGLATAGIILGVIFTIGGVIGIVAFGVAIGGAAAECAKLGNGTHIVGNSTYRCEPGSVNVSTN
jgi:hypothetical protein